MSKNAWFGHMFNKTSSFPSTDSHRQLWVTCKKSAFVHNTQPLSAHQLNAMAFRCQANGGPCQKFLPATCVLTIF